MAATYTGGPAQAEAKASTVNYMYVYGAPITVTSSKHHQLRVSASVSRNAGMAPYLRVTVSTPSGSESHSWSFQVPNSAWNLGATGSGKVKVTSKQTGGFGSLTLTVAGSGAVKQTKCQGQPVSGTRHATVSGMFVFDTKAGWGKVGSTRHKTSFSKASNIYWSYDNTATCPTSPTPCTAYNGWNVSTDSATAYTTVSGTTSGKSSYVYGYRSVQLAKPKGASRTDLLTQSNPKPMKLTVNSDNTATGKGYAGKGSVTITSTDQATPSSSPCGDGTRNRTVMSWYGADIHQNSPPAKMAAQIYGAIVVPNTGTGSMTKVTVTG
jgi:hypothetical protein